MQNGMIGCVNFISDKTLNELKILNENLPKKLYLTDFPNAINQLRFIES